MQCKCGGWVGLEMLELRVFHWWIDTALGAAPHHWKGCFCSIDWSIPQQSEPESAEPTNDIPTESGVPPLEA